MKVTTSKPAPSKSDVARAFQRASLTIARVCWLSTTVEASPPGTRKDRRGSGGPPSFAANSSDSRDFGALPRCRSEPRDGSAGARRGGRGCRGARGGRAAGAIGSSSNPSVRRRSSFWRMLSRRCCS
eukprot:176623-Prymnesium_polylepis.4